MKRPWMPLYVADYLSKTSHLTAAESGAYLHLLMYYWTHMRLPSDEKAIARITRMSPMGWAKSRDRIKEFFDDSWCNPRMEKEIAKAIEISKTNSANAKRRYSERTANADTLHTSHTQRLKNGYEFLKKEEGFKAMPASKEFIAWTAYAFEKNVPLWRELQKREIEGRGFDFATQWPPEKATA